MTKFLGQMEFHTNVFVLPKINYKFSSSSFNNCHIYVNINFYVTIYTKQIVILQYNQFLFRIWKEVPDIWITVKNKDFKHFKLMSLVAL